jgi:DNA helicase-2/ATP-dependent DNA helicase PcrA
VELTETQKNIVEAPLGALLVTAGAGSGKTRTLTHRLLHLLENGIYDYQIAALTFTNKAGNEMRERVEKMLGHPIDTFIGTFHSFCVRILRKNIDKLNGQTNGNYTNDFSIYADDDTRKVIKQIINEKGAVKDDEKEEFAKKVRFHLGEYKNSGLNLNKYTEQNRYVEGIDSVREIIVRYKEILAGNNALDFDDLLLKTLELLFKCTEVAEKLQEHFKYILVDEFQDTNKIQYEIVSILAAKHRNIMVVGDEDQSIYSWRGADVTNILRFQKDFPEAKIYKLEENFRSSKNIVDFASDLVSANRNRIKKVLFSNIPDGVIEFNCFNTQYGVSAEEIESDFVLRNIVENKRSGGRYNDIAVLMRINALSRVFEKKLQAFGVPYVVWGGFKFYERAEVKMSLDYMRVLVNPNDEVALFNIINCPRRGIGGTTIEKIRGLAKLHNKMCFEIIKHLDSYGGTVTGKAKNALADFAAILDKLKEISAEGLINLAAEFPSVSGLADFYANDRERGDDKVENINQLMGEIVKFTDLGSFLQTVSLSGAEDPDAEDKVVLSTIHSAKGLEFNTVFVVGLENGIFPLYSKDDDELEEERRLLYVAVTRARRNLYLSYSRSRFIYGQRRPQEKSRLLADIDFNGEHGGGDDDWQWDFAAGGNYNKRRNSSADGYHNRRRNPAADNYDGDWLF